MFFCKAIAVMSATLSVSGQTITDLKTGYWLGSTPAAGRRSSFWEFVPRVAGIDHFSGKDFSIWEAPIGFAGVLVASRPS
jgi:hypothetical protein